MCCSSVGFKCIGSGSFALIWTWAWTSNCCLTFAISSMLILLKSLTSPAVVLCVWLWAGIGPVCLGRGPFVHWRTNYLVSACLGVQTSWGFQYWNCCSWCNLNFLSSAMSSSLFLTSFFMASNWIRKFSYSFSLLLSFSVRVVLEGL